MLFDILKVIWSRKMELFLFSFVATAAAFIICFFLPKQYESKASILITPALVDPQVKMVSLSPNSYKELATLPSVLSNVVDELKSKGIDPKNVLHPEILRKMIELENTGPKRKKPGELLDPFIITLIVKGNEPSLIKEVANTLLLFWVEEIKKVQKESFKVNQIRLQEKI